MNLYDDILHRPLSLVHMFWDTILEYLLNFNMNDGCDLEMVISFIRRNAAFKLDVFFIIDYSPDLLSCMDTY